MRINLLATVKMGSVGDLRIGLDEARVVALLGEPDARSRRHKPLKIQRYGMVQLHFDSGRLVIMSVHFDGPRTWPTIEFVGWFPNIGVTRDEFIEALEVRGVAHRRLAGIDPSALITEGQAVVNFLGNELASISIESPEIRGAIG